MTKERIIAGIDIGSTKICTVIAQVLSDKISVVGVSSTPSKGIKKGVVVDIDQAVEAISGSLEAAERMAGTAVGSAYVGVNGSHIGSLNSKGVVAVGSGDGEIHGEDVTRATEAAQAISIPGSQEIIHVLARDFVIDGQEGVKNPVGMSGVRLEVETNIIYGLVSSIRNIGKCIAQVGVEISGLVFTGYASSESILTETEKDSGTALVDIGGGTPQICIFEGGSPNYSCVLPVGGQNITNDLAIGLRTSIENSEKIKIKFSQGLDPTEGGVLENNELVTKKAVEEITHARLSEIFNLVASEIKKSGCSGTIPGGIVISGGGAETAGVLEVGRAVLKTPVRLGTPTGVTGLIDEIVGPAYSCPVGLILFGAHAKGESPFSIFGKRGLPKTLTRAADWIKSFLP